MLIIFTTTIESSKNKVIFFCLHNSPGRISSMKRSNIEFYNSIIELDTSPKYFLKQKCKEQ